MQAEFIRTAVLPEQFPPESLPEIAFLGRSNVGKSSLLNALAATRGLAHTSAIPGRTQAINFFRVRRQWCFVDLPGYGYARVPLELAASWKRLIESYLVHRRALRLCLVLLDARRGWMEKDEELRRWLEHHRRPYVVVATKFDKLGSQAEKCKGVAAIGSHRNESRWWLGEPISFSARTGQGVREIWQAIAAMRDHP